MIVGLLCLLQPPIAAETVEIRIVEGEGWGGAGVRDIKAVLDSTAKNLLKYFPDRKLSPIIVEHTTGSPVALYALGPNGEFRVHLNSKGLRWSQYSYQFSHELTHVLAGYKKVEPNSPPNQWFEESLCMMGSLFTMRRMSESWKTEPPYPNWKDYAPHLGSYVDDVMKKPEHNLPAGTTLAQWYKTNEQKLRTGSSIAGEDRAMQSVVASVLLPHFEATPENWPAIGYLNVKKTGDSSFKTYLDAWQDSAPAKYRPFIKAIRAKFGVPSSTR